VTQSLSELLDRATAEIAKSDSLTSLDQARVRYLGKSGELTAMMKSLGSLAPEDRKSFGQGVNSVKAKLEEAIEQRRAILEQTARPAGTARMWEVATSSTATTASGVSTSPPAPPDVICPVPVSPADPTFMAPPLPTAAPPLPTLLPPAPVAPPAQLGPASLLLDSPVRSGQSVVFRAGDVTVLGSVASGAEIVAGGSIHVYGTLRGRALAGSTGNPRARIFCRKIEAELLAIDGIYRTTEDLEPTLRSRAIQAWLQDDVMFIEPLDESH
jgi:septum formation inhibitor MinC